MAEHYIFSSCSGRLLAHCRLKQPLFLSYTSLHSNLHTASAAFCMRLSRLISSLVLTLACSSIWAQSQQQNFEHGEDAYQRKDYANALALWLPLAEQQHSLAQYNIAYMYQKGLGTAANDAAACTWFSQAAAQHDLAAIVATGRCYAEGKGVAQDLSLATALYLRAAVNGDPQAQYLYAQAQERGLGVQPNTELALEWYKKAAANGHLPAQQQLQTLAQNSVAVVVPTSINAKTTTQTATTIVAEPSAMSKLLAAAAQGNVQAQYQAGLRLAQRRSGTVADLPQAVRLLRKARSGGHPNAQEALDRLGFGE